MVRVKICGIRDTATANAAVEAGADALGFVFAPGRRQVHPETARAIIQRLPPFVVTVGVFVDAPLEQVRATAAYCGLHMVQLHGDETPEYCRAVNRPVIKAVRFKCVDDCQWASNYAVEAILVDAWVPGKAGGTGRKLEWETLRGLIWHRPLVLAGGLSPENVAEAVHIVSPYAVDVSSGVETEGLKDPARIRAFVTNAKGGGTPRVA